jgi:hypothetical protein
MNDLFGIRQSIEVDRHRSSGHRLFLEHSAVDHGGDFKHPLLTRLAQHV